MSKLWSNTTNFILEYKTSLVGLFLIVSVGLALYSWYKPVETMPNITDYTRETKMLPYIIQNRDLVILIEYNWMDTVYMDEWECKKVDAAPKAKLIYTVKNNGERFDEILYLPVPEYIYPDQFQALPEFTWINGLYIVVQDQPLEKGAMETYEFTLNLQAYKEVCDIKNEVDGYSKEVENRYKKLIESKLPSDVLNQIDEAYISFKSAKEEVDRVVEIIRAGDPSLTLAAMGKIDGFSIRQKAVLSQNTIANEYSLLQAEIRIERMQEAVSQSNIDEILNEIRGQRQELNSLKTQLEKQLDKPSLEDLLEAYYNMPR